MSLRKIFFLPDCHIPYHDQRALRLVLKVAKEFKPDILVTLGDLADFFSISRYSKDPARAYRLDWEVEQVNEVLDQLDSLGARKKIFVAGNHCDRLQRYLQEKAPELFAFIDVPRLFRLDSRGWQFVPYKDSTQIGKLHITHDVGSAGRYSIFRCLEAFQAPIVTAHTHRLGYIVEGNAKGETMVSLQLGWLGDVSKVDYMHRIQAKRNWSLGFGVGYLDPASRNVHVTAIPIVSYRCVIEGVLYRG